MGIAGNETADALARNESEEKFIGPEPFCGYQICHVKERLKMWEKGGNEKYWKSLADRSQSRTLIKYSRKIRELWNS